MNVPFVFNGIHYDASDIIGVGDCLSNEDRILRLTGFDEAFLKAQKLDVAIPVMTASGQLVFLTMDADMPDDVLMQHRHLTRDVCYLGTTSVAYRKKIWKPGDPPTTLCLKQTINGRPRQLRAIRKLVDVALAETLAPHFAELRNRLLTMVAGFLAARDAARGTPADMLVAAE